MGLHNCRILQSRIGEYGVRTRKRYKTFKIFSSSTTEVFSVLWFPIEMFSDSRTQMFPGFPMEVFSIYGINRND